MLQLEPIPALNDNYIWLLHQRGQALIVDPGESAPVLELLNERGLKLQAILLTHHHLDHTEGASQLKNATGARVFGPRKSRLAFIDQPQEGGEQLQLMGATFQVLATPGHTLDHIVYYSADATAHPLLFSGDTLFSAGCGRLFEGNAGQLFAALEQISALPPSTQICCAHEYTLSNLAFAQAVEPANQAIEQRINNCRLLRQQHRPTLPSDLAQEKSTNPFLRYREPDVKAAAERQSGHSLDTAELTLAALRQWKDQF